MELIESISDIINNSSRTDPDADGLRNRRAAAVSRLMTRTVYNECDEKQSPRFKSSVHSRPAIGCYRTSGFGGCVDINSTVRDIKRLTGRHVECNVDTTFDESSEEVVPVLETVVYESDDEPALETVDGECCLESATPLASDDESDELSDARVSYDELISNSSKRMLYATLVFRCACVVACVFIASKLSLYCFSVISAYPM